MESRINPGSGNTYWRPGDVLDDILHTENKERKPSFTTKGKKQITIDVRWLLEAIREAEGKRKFPVVTFSLTGDDTIFALANFNTIAAMAHEIKYLRYELAKLREECKLDEL
jgi:hypothetical protein